MFLYIFRWLTEDQISPFVMILLSDVNSLFMLATFYVLSRGSNVTLQSPGQLLLVFVVIMAGVISVDLLLYKLSEFVFPSFPLLFIRPWSVALAVSAPYMIGRAFKKRYGTNSVWVFGVAYALCQPLAYGAIFFPTDVDHRKIVVCIQNEKKEDLSPAAQSLLTPHIERDMSRVANDHGLYLVRIPEPSSDGMRTKWSDIDVILDAAVSEGLVRAWIQLKFESMLFTLLATLKVLFCAHIMLHIQRVPSKIRVPTLEDNTAPGFQNTKPWDCLIEGYKYWFFSLLVVAASMVGILLVLHGFDVKVTAVFAVVGVLISSMLYFMRGNRTLAQWQPNARRRRSG